MQGLDGELETQRVAVERQIIVTESKRGERGEGGKCDTRSVRGIEGKGRSIIGKKTNACSCYLVRARGMRIRRYAQNSQEK